MWQKNAVIVQNQSRLYCLCSTRMGTGTVRKTALKEGQRKYTILKIKQKKAENKTL